MRDTNKDTPGSVESLVEVEDRLAADSLPNEELVDALQAAGLPEIARVLDRALDQAAPADAR